MIGELLSGSAPPVEFFNPFGFVLLVSLYGSGALLIREIRVRWKTGIGAVLLLGAAYGVLEEGVMVGSFFNPHWPDLGELGIYGRWLGVNWIWALMLTMYHAIYSITIPILLVELAYPEHRDKPWLSRRRFQAVTTLLISVVTLGSIMFNGLSGYLPPLLPYLTSVVMVLLFGYAAYRLPVTWGNGSLPVPNPWIFWLLGTIGTFSFFFGFWLMPKVIPSWLAGFLICLLFLFFTISTFTRYQWHATTEKHRFALASGALTFFLVFAPLSELDTSRMDNPTGMSVVGLAFLIGLLFLNRRITTTSDREHVPFSSLSSQTSSIPVSRIRKYCTCCGIILPASAAYCPHCGTPISS
jgi:hypothetical protein